MHPTLTAFGFRRRNGSPSRTVPVTFDAHDTARAPIYCMCIQFLCTAGAPITVLHRLPEAAGYGCRQTHSPETSDRRICSDQKNDFKSRFRHARSSSDPAEHLQIQSNLTPSAEIIARCLLSSSDPEMKLASSAQIRQLWRAHPAAKQWHRGSDRRRKTKSWAVSCNPAASMPKSGHHRHRISYDFRQVDWGSKMESEQRRKSQQHAPAATAKSTRIRIKQNRNDGEEEFGA
ncbi:hypothetical protein ACLOJK_031219 [Asimina triloba]